MTRYLVLTYTLFVATLLLLLGLGNYPNDNFSYTLYGYGRFDPNAVYLTIAALGGAAAWNFVQWRKSGTGPASTSIHFALAHGWFLAGVLLLVGTWAAVSANRVTVFGHGRFEPPPVYITNIALFVVAVAHLRRWRKAGRPGVSEAAHFALANAWFLAGVVLFLGIGNYPGNRHYGTIYGYGKLEEVSPYLAVGLLFLAAFWNFRQWRKAGRTEPVPPPVVPAVRPARGPNWAVIGAVGCGLFFLMIFVLRTGVTPVAPAPIQPPFFPAPPPGVGHWPIATPAPAVGTGGTAVRVWVLAPVLALLVFGGFFWAYSRKDRPRNGPSPLVWYTGLVLIPLAALIVVARMTADTGQQFDRPETVVFTLLFTAAYEALFFLARWLYLRVNGAPSRGQPGPRDQATGDDGWTPYQKRRVAGWFQVIATVVTTLLLVLTFREYGRNDTTFNTTLAYLVVWSIVAFVVSRRLYRWAYPEWDANRQGVSVPERGPAEVPVAQVPPRRDPTPSRTCPKCAAPITPDAPQGLCPRCLMAGAFQSILNPNRTGAYNGPFAPPTPEEVQEFFPHLEIQGLVGHGGMGAVYQARQPNLDRVVALKLIRPREDNPMFAERFVREAKAMAKLSHPNIVTIYESGDAGGSLFLIMEYVDGVTLREAIRAKAVQPADAMKIVGQLCDALEYAHRQGVVHRDIKPENILLDRTGKVKVVDFGLAKLADDSAMSLTHTRQAMGTPHYMAPEQWEKPTEVDHRADIYALGVVIYELLTGELPLGRFDPPSVKARLDARIDEIVLRLLAKEPDKRYQNASDVRTALFNVGDWQETGRVVRHFGTRGRRDYFYEYKSETEIWGWPLVHIVSGVDPRTGTRRIAKGWIALGDVMAIGVLSLSGIFAVGLFSLAGVLSLGLIAVGGSLGVGGVATGGLAAGVVAVGGVAAGWLAIGGLAAGKFAIGGAAFGEHVLSGRRKDPDFWEQLREQVGGWFN